MATIPIFKKKGKALIIKREGFQVTLTIPLKSILHAGYHMQMEEFAGNI